MSEEPPRRRPIALMEDHLYHIGEALALFERQIPEALGWLTVVCLDRPGPDTRRLLRSWLERYRDLQVMAIGAFDDPRCVALDPVALARPNDLARAIAGLLRPGGLLLQDIQLETLSFIPRDRWWESIYVATSLRGMFPGRPLVCRFLSNKKGYEATFGRDLLDAGFDPRDVLDKGALEKLLAPTLRSFLRRSMPMRLEVVGGGPAIATVIGDDSAARAEVEAAVDLLLWHDARGIGIGGRSVRPAANKPRRDLKPGSQEGETWRALLGDAFAGGEGVPVLEVGRRTAPQFAGRAEITNCAARHIHLLRSRLVDPAAILTVEHTYRLDRRLRVARVDPPPATS